MGRHMVLPGLLFCVAVTATGCRGTGMSWKELDAGGKVRVYGRQEFRTRELRLQLTEPERFARMRRRRSTGIWLGVLGGVGAFYGLAEMINSCFPSTQDDAMDYDLAAGLAAAGSASLLIGAIMEGSYTSYVRKEGRRRRGQVLIGPNGCGLAYRF